MNLIAWLLFGVVVGMIGYLLDPQEKKHGLQSSILLGMGGALLGGVVANTLFGLTLEKFNLTSFMLAVSGSLLLLVTGKALRRI